MFSMARYSRLWQARVGVSIWAVSTAFLAVAPKLIYDLEYNILLQMLVAQGIAAIAIGLASGLITAIWQRSAKAGGIVLLGIFYGGMVGGTSSFAISWFFYFLLSLLFETKSVTDSLLPGLGLILTTLFFWVVGQLAGALWGGVSWFQWYAINRSLRSN